MAHQCQDRKLDMGLRACESSSQVQGLDSLLILRLRRLKEVELREESIEVLCLAKEQLLIKLTD